MLIRTGNLLHMMLIQKERLYVFPYNPLYLKKHEKLFILFFFYKLACSIKFSLHFLSIDHKFCFIGLYVVFVCIFPFTSVAVEYFALNAVLTVAGTSLSDIVLSSFLSASLLHDCTVSNEKQIIRLNNILFIKIIFNKKGKCDAGEKI